MDFNELYKLSLKGTLAEIITALEELKTKNESLYSNYIDLVKEMRVIQHDNLQEYVLGSSLFISIILSNLAQEEEGQNFVKSLISLADSLGVAYGKIDDILKT